jgi:hypothetical protein
MPDVLEAVFVFLLAATTAWHIVESRRLRKAINDVKGTK